MPGKLSRAWQDFRYVWKRHGYDRAVASLLASTHPDDFKSTILERAGQLNMAALTIKPDEYRRNRRRAGAFE